MPVVNCLTIQDDGKIILGGSFICTNGVVHTNIARINPDGSPDDSFAAQVVGPGIYDLWGGSVDSIIIQADGKLLVTGGFTSVNGAPRTSIARLNRDGMLDDTFNPILDPFYSQPEVNAAALQSDGKILIAGKFQGVNETPQNFLARLKSDGSPDLIFQSGMGNNDGGTIHALDCQADGKIIIGGVFTSVNGAPHNGIARLNANGSIDSSFQADAGWVYSLMIQSDGRIIIGGTFSQVNGVPQYCVALLKSDGSLDNSIPNGVAGYDSSGQVSKIVIQADGKIIFGGNFRSSARSYIARLNPGGLLDTGFCNGPIGPNNRIQSMVVQPDQKVLVAGSFPQDSAYPSASTSILRLNIDGSLDGSYLHKLTTANSQIKAMVLESDGKLLLAGYFTSINNTARNRIARLNSDGSLDNSFLQGLAGVDNQVNCMALQVDGKILIAGNFTSFNGVTRYRVARLNADGSLDTAFLQSAAGADNTVLCMALQSDGKILVGGYFTAVNGQTRNRVARLNSDGLLDDTFLNGLDGANGPVMGLAIQPDGKILIGGSFTAVNGISVTNLVRLSPNGALDSSFRYTGPAPFFSPLIPSGFVAIQTDGKIVVGVRNLFRLNYDGSIDDSFFSQVWPNMGVSCLLFGPDGKLLIGGGFTAVNQIPRSFVARLMGEYAPPNIKSLSQSQTAEAGSTVRFCVHANGYPPLSYQWFLNGVLLSGRTNQCLDLSSVEFGDLGAFTVVVNSLSGSITSAPVMLNVIVPVPHRPVPAIAISGHAGNSVTIEYADSVNPPLTWNDLDTVSLSTAPQFYFDLTAPLSQQRFYRARQSGSLAVQPTLALPSLVPSITLTGQISYSVRIDSINEFGPTDAWFTLDTVTLTNTQLYFDVSAIGQPQRLYRLTQMP
jgi:uncharacterized delta-60 repeat protein